ncbi:hypothetical protein [Paenibacillus lactis]|uniref:hypothetical protein n=1 Tax=Paenibacillus lactis TaxID=228574 RepID=UPI003D720A82
MNKLMSIVIVLYGLVAFGFAFSPLDIKWKFVGILTGLIFVYLTITYNLLLSIRKK